MPFFTLGLAGYQVSTFLTELGTEGELLLVFCVFVLAELLETSVSEFCVLIPKVMILFHFLGRAVHVEYICDKKDEGAYSLSLGAELVPQFTNFIVGRGLVVFFDEGELL